MNFRLKQYLGPKYHRQYLYSSSGTFCLARRHKVRLRQKHPGAYEAFHNLFCQIITTENRQCSTALLNLTIAICYFFGCTKLTDVVCQTTWYGVVFHLTPAGSCVYRHQILELIFPFNYTSVSVGYKTE